VQPEVPALSSKGVKIRPLLTSRAVRSESDQVQAAPSDDALHLGTKARTPSRFAAIIFVHRLSKPLLMARPRRAMGPWRECEPSEIVRSAFSR